MAKTIRNGRAFPAEVKVATIATWVGTNRSAAVIAREYNMCKSTVSLWVADAGVQRGTQHPNLKAAIATIHANKAAIKAFNTPTIQPDGSILLKGKFYR